MIWLRALAPTAIALIIAALLAGLVSDTMAARWLALALVIQAVMVTLVMARLHFWAALPRQRELPQVGGVWQPRSTVWRASSRPTARAANSSPPSSNNCTERSTGCPTA